MVHKAIIHFRLLLLCFFILITWSCEESGPSEKEISQEEISGQDPILEDYESPDRKVGFINEKGEVVIQARFDEAHYFQYGLAAVNSAGLWGYIDRQGSMVIPPQYLGAWTFYNGMARVQSKDDRRFGFIGLSGDTIVPLKYEEARDFKTAIAAVRSGAFWGVVDKQADERIPPQFDNVKVLTAEYVAVQEKEHWGVWKIDKGIVIPAVYKEIYDLSGNILRVRQDNGKYNYLNLEDQAVFDREFFKAYDPQEGVYAVCDSPQHCYLLNSSKERISEVYDHIHPSNEGTFLAKENGKWGVVNGKGTQLIPLRYELIYNFQEGFAPYLKNHLWGYLSSGGSVMTPPQFGLAWPFQNGKARVLTRSGTAIINEDFQTIISPEVGEIRDFYEGLAAFRAY